jgi:hypothetical protein
VVFEVALKNPREGIFLGSRKYVGTRGGDQQRQHRVGAAGEPQAAGLVVPRD